MHDPRHAVITAATLSLCLPALACSASNTSKLEANQTDGGGAGRLKGGRHVRYNEPTPLANLHLTLLEKAGVRMDSFADSRGKVDELLSI